MAIEVSFFHSEVEAFDIDNWLLLLLFVIDELFKRKGGIW